MNTLVYNEVGYIWMNALNGKTSSFTHIVITDIQKEVWLRCFWVLYTGAVSIYIVDRSDNRVIAIFIQ